MSEILADYTQRLDQRNIRKATNQAGALEPDHQKFYPDGRVRPYYGLTCIAWIQQHSPLFQRLLTCQRALQEDFQVAGLDGVFTFLAPHSFHITVCDIETACEPIATSQIQRRVQELQHVLPALEHSGQSTCQIQGLGLAKTITPLVQFSEDAELRKILRIEHTLKAATGVNVREFAGHISLAYIVRSPGENLEQVKEILLPYETQSFGTFTFSRFDLTYFTDMNTFQPLLTVEL